MTLDPKCHCLACDGYLKKLAAWRSKQPNHVMIVCDRCKERYTKLGLKWEKIPDSEFTF